VVTRRLLFSSCVLFFISIASTHPNWTPHIVRGTGTFSAEGQLSGLDVDRDVGIVIPSSTGAL
jgi:hypothetical protein